ncbi:NADP-dependent oxidoreductase [Nocardia otitidiscaviarum]|uniref:NADP-dependent oxidoreductase n=1 Tax=Nocardia otitidiscaviarum TaxID=1823 RepID=UPI0004A6D546|nr:NADP-dependent oxidoreductase [Nocardia otitidiscaviarum]MBF6138010.1 NADP-dependent oxidoreductase [Nocardia otitidiscaviarum]MBF6241727.1 NADP-dependent oxidoreductase [Nocardia otitidiscaviarum]MBF6489117.1 NADP-dependent oxidoreductase [Nocardia otitidiscaviarum]
MRAIVVREFGGTPEPADMPVPEPGPGQLRIRLDAAGVNPFDRKIVDGVLDGRLPHDFPLIPGLDGAGAVSALGAGVPEFAVGDRVAGKWLVPPVGHGTFAEYIVVPHDSVIARLPDEVTALAAAALPTAGLTALDLLEGAAIGAGQTVLIPGAAGGVGSFLVQLAAAAGAHVIATARPDDADRMIRLGATEVIDYGRTVPVSDSPEPALDQPTIAESVRMTHPDGIDALLDLVSPPAALRELAALVRPGGAVFSTIGSVDTADLQTRGIKAGNINSQGSAAGLARLLAAAAAGDLVVPVDHAVPLAEAATVIGGSGARGKTVLVI